MFAPFRLCDHRIKRQTLVASFKTVAIVQARMSSSRLPGKVLLPLADREVLFHVWERLSVVKNIDKIVIATTNREDDLPLVRYCEEHGIEIFTYAGSEEDLLGRYIACAKHYQADVVVMVCSDCPLLHPPSIERMVQALLDHPEAEYCQLDPPSIEGGVAVLRLGAYEKMAQLATQAAHREHATLFLMENPQMFSSVSVPSDKELQGIKHRLWLDTPADYVFLNEVYERLYRPGKIVDLHKVVQMLHTDKQLTAINKHVTQKDVRANQYRLCIQTTAVEQALIPVALEFCAILIECYHFGLRILTEGMGPDESQVWRSRMFSLSDRPIKAGEVLVTLGAGTEGVIAEAPGEQGEPRICIGLKTPMKLAQLAELMACYLGEEGGTHGHYVPKRMTENEGESLETVTCPLCGSQDRDQVWTHNTGVINARCRSCDHIYLARRPLQLIIHASYEEFKQNYGEQYLLDKNGSTFLLAKSRFNLVKRFQEQPPGSVLEIGSGYGHFLSHFKQGCLKVGIEPSREQASFSRKHFGLANIWECGYERLESNRPDWPKAGFDLVSSFHVLEHVEQPDRLLRFIKQNLREGGLLCISVPNLLTLSPDLIELYFLCRGLHLHTFSPARLEKLLAQEGFEVIDIREEQGNTMLRSSVMLVARSVSNPPERKLQEQGGDEIKAALANFHDTLDIKLRKVRAAFEKWHAAGRKITVYGAGIHTRALLDLTGVSPEWINVIIDDDPVKQNTFLHGIAISDLRTVLEQAPDVIVVSSLASEDAILAHLQDVAPVATELFGIYRDLMRD